jgi:NHLM bacteriocin system ABC transporter ATP-binding protein
LLGCLQDGRRPVALLPSRGGYLCFDPGTDRRAAVTAANEGGLERRAYMLYRPLPVSPVGVFALLHLALARHWRDLVGVVVISIVTVFFGMASIQAFGLVVDRIIPDADRGLLVQLGLGLLALGVASILCESRRAVYSLRAETGADHTLQSAAWDHLLALPLPFFRKYPAGDLLSRVSAVHEIRRVLSGVTLRTLLSSVFGLLNWGLLLYLCWQLALLALVVAGLVALLTVSAALVLFSTYSELLQLNGRLASVTVQLIQMVPKLRVAAAEERAFAWWAKSYGEQKRLWLRVLAINDVVWILNELIGIASLIAVFSLALNLQPTPDFPRTMTTGTLLASFAAYAAFVGSARDLSNVLTQILYVFNLWHRAQPVLTAKPEAGAGKIDPGPLQGGVVVEHLTFRYQSNGPATLDNIGLSVAPGEFVAIVGPSGGGKSTLIRLLLGFETPESGRILFDNQDLSGLDLHAVRRQLGAVLQNSRLQPGSLYENIACGASLSLTEVEEAAEAAGLASDLARMPMGLHSLVSAEGSNLSAGQRQRVLIARALIGKPRILLFDEATSSLDNRTQSLITEHLEQLRITRIVVAHRLSTIRRADRIYVLDRGAIVQQGSFEELIREEGLFARLAARQRP